MNMVTKSLLKSWRKEYGLKKWGLFSDYRKLFGENVLTLYAYSEHLVPREPKWGGHIHVTGFRQGEETADYQPEKELTGYPSLFIVLSSVLI